MHMVTYRDKLWDVLNDKATIGEIRSVLGFYTTCLDNGDLDVINEDWGEEDGPLTEKDVEKLIKEIEEKFDEEHWRVINAD